MVFLFDLSNQSAFPIISFKEGRYENGFSITSKKIKSLEFDAKDYELRSFSITRQNNPTTLLNTWDKRRTLLRIVRTYSEESVVETIYNGPSFGSGKGREHFYPRIKIQPSTNTERLVDFAALNLYPLKNDPMASWSQANKIDFHSFSRKSVTSEMLKWLLRTTALLTTLVLLFLPKIRKLIKRIRKKWTQGKRAGLNQHKKSLPNLQGENSWSFNKLN